MGLFSYSKGNGIIGSSVQEYIDKRFPVCPICGSRRPEWEFKVAVKMENRTQFRCNKCGSSLSISVPEMIGLTKITSVPLLAIIFWPVTVIYAVIKLLRGQKITKMYVNIESIEGNIENPVLKAGQSVQYDWLAGLMRQL